MKILITGASGFIGRALFCFTGIQGAEVSAVLRRPVDDFPGVKQLIVPDLVAFDDWQRHLNGIDVVVHCAGLAHTKADKEAYYAVNTDVTRLLAESCERAGVKRFIFLSSLKVLGERTVGRKKFQNDSPANPVDPYGKSKWLAEQQLLGLHNRSQLDVVIIRLPLVYGVNVKANFQRLMHVARLPLPLPFAGVVNRRDIVSLENLCDVIECCLTHPAAAGKTLMVSDGQPYSLADLLDRVRRVTGRRRWLFNVPLPLLRLAFALTGRRDMAGRLFGDLEVDISETQRLLDWQPKYTLEDTLRKMLL
jgi:UDP-glucose 4-epimerase